MAHDRIEIRSMGRSKLVIGGVAGESGNIGNAAFFKDPVDFKTVTANIVFAKQVYFEFTRLDFIIFTDDMAEHLVVGDMVSCRLGNSFISLTTEGIDITVA